MTEGILPDATRYDGNNGEQLEQNYHPDPKVWLKARNHSADLRLLGRSTQKRSGKGPEFHHGGEINDRWTEQRRDGGIFGYSTGQSCLPLLQGVC